MDIETEAGSNTDGSEQSLSDDSNLSSLSLLRTLIEHSETDTSFRNMSIQEKFDKVPHHAKVSYFEQRETITYDDSYNKDVEEHMRRTLSDRRKSFKDVTIPKYLSTEYPAMLKRTTSRPDLGELRIPLMTQVNRSLCVRKSSRLNSTTYVGKLHSIYAAGPDTPSRPRRVSTIRLDQYKQKIKEGEDEMSDIRASSHFVNDYTTKEKKIIDEVLGDIPFRKESVYVPYGKLSYLRGMSNVEGEITLKEGEEPTNIFAPSRAESRLPSYDESLLPSKDSYQISFRSGENERMKNRSTMWERAPSSNEFILDPQPSRTSTSPNKKSVRFTEHK